MFIDSKSNRVEILADGWSVMAQGNAAHFEHTVAVTDDDPLILTKEV
jgi:methionyl aminopeptidase